MTRRPGTHAEALRGPRPSHFRPAEPWRPPSLARIGRPWTGGDAIGLGLPDVRGRGPGRVFGRHVADQPFSLRDAAELAFETVRFGGSVPREAVAGKWGVGDPAPMLPHSVPCQLPPFLTFKLLGHIYLCVQVPYGCQESNLGVGSRHRVGPGDRT